MGTASRPTASLKGVTVPAAAGVAVASRGSIHPSSSVVESQKIPLLSPSSLLGPRTALPRQWRARLYTPSEDSPKSN